MARYVSVITTCAGQRMPRRPMLTQVREGGSLFAQGIHLLTQGLHLLTQGMQVYIQSSTAGGLRSAAWKLEAMPHASRRERYKKLRER